MAGGAGWTMRGFLPSERSPMSCTLTVDGPCRRTLKFSVQRDRLDEAIAAGMREVAQHTKIKGFRPGKVPLDLVRKLHGKRVAEDARRQVMSEVLSEAIREHDLRPLGDPEMNLEALEDEAEGPLNFELALEVAPEIELAKIEGLPVTARLPVLDDATLDGEVDRFRQQFAEMDEVPNDVEVSDKSVLGVTITYTVDGEALDPRADRTVLVEHDLVDGIKIEGAGKALLGRTRGDSLPLEAELPSHFEPVELGGKAATLDLTIDTHRVLKVPELNEDLLKKVGVGSEDELRQRLREQLEMQVQRLRNEQVDRGIEQALLEAHSFELPERFLSQAIERRVHEYAHRLMEERKMSAEEGHHAAEEEREKIAKLTRDGLRASLIFSKIAGEKQLSATPDEAEEQIRTMAAMQQADPEKTLQAAYQEGWIDDVRSRITEEKTRSWLRERADVTEEQQPLSSP